MTESDRLLIAYARALHDAGAPSNVVEELSRAVAIAIRADLQVNALPTSLTLAIGPADEQHVVMMRLEPGSLDLGRLGDLDRLRLALIGGTVTTTEALALIERFGQRGRLPQPAGIASMVVLAFAIAVLLGGGWIEVAVSSSIGLATGLVEFAGDRNSRVNRLFEVIAAFLATVIVGLAHYLLGPFAVYIAIVAGVVQLLPGFTLTTALHELANRNLVAGSALLAQSFLVLVSLTCGAALGIAVVGERAFTNTMHPLHPLWWPWLVVAIVAVALGELVQLRGRSGNFLAVLVACAGAIVTSHFLALIATTAVVAFVSAMVVGILAQLGARLFRVSQALMLIPGTVVLVPGALGYEGFLSIYNATDATDGVTFALHALTSAILLVAGLLFAQLVFSRTAGATSATA